MAETWTIREIVLCALAALSYIGVVAMFFKTLGILPECCASSVEQYPSLSIDIKSEVNPMTTYPESNSEQTPLTDKELRQMEQWAGAWIDPSQSREALIRGCEKTDAYLKSAIQEIRRSHVSANVVDPTVKDSNLEFDVLTPEQKSAANVEQLAYWTWRKLSGLNFANISGEIDAAINHALKAFGSDAFSAYNQAVEDAKAAIRDAPSYHKDDDYCAASFITAIARKCSPHVYVNRLAAAPLAAIQDEAPTFRTTKEAMLYAQQHGIPAVIPAAKPSGAAQEAAEEILSSISVNEFREMQRFNNYARIQSLIESKLPAPTTEEGAG